MKLKLKVLAAVLVLMTAVSGLSEDLILPQDMSADSFYSESEVNMPNIPQIKIGSTTYDLHDNRVDDLKSALNIETSWRDGKYLDANGVYLDYSPYQASEKIPVHDSTGLIKMNIHIRVTVNSATYIVFFDKEQNVISSETTNIGNETIYETDTDHVPGCFYVAISNYKQYTPQIWGSYKSTDLKYILSLLPQEWNMFDKNNPNIQENKYINDDKRILDLAGYSISHLIPIIGGVSYTYTQPASAFGQEAHYAICSPDGVILDVRLPQIQNNVVTFTEQSSCFIKVNIYSVGTSGFGAFRFCKTSDVEKSSSVYHGRLEGKKILYNGDSIAESRYSGFSSNGGGYPKIISDVTGGTFENRSIGGGTLAVHGTSHNICTDIVNMSDEGDIICLEGGMNDYWGDVPLGTYSQSAFDNEVDNTTICGALEYMFRTAINKWVGKPIVFVIVHKIKVTAWNNNSAGYSFADVRDKMIGICNKYSIPYLDMWAEGGLNAYMSVLDEAYLNGGAREHPDGCHPDENGYIKYYVPRLISLFESVLPFE